jgi:desulfoferrodoxin-like iron-binding protein
MAVKNINEKYRCNICGNEVVVTKVGGGALVCCGRDMELIDAGSEKEEKNNNKNFMDDQTIKSTGCCEPFDPAPWQDTSAGSGQVKEITWQDKIFVRDSVKSFLHIPLDMGKKIVKNMALIEKAGAKAPYQLMLTDEKSMWGADIYIDVSKEVPGVKMAKLSGTFLTKVFEGPYQNAGKWAMEMKKYVEDKGKVMQKLYFAYTTCPKCAKAYGKNYAVLFAQV